ncbi:hypothetical protein AN933_29850 [Mycobacterium intracellulare subsp. chimaera]|nr:hypothetical protein AN933_29850 [Mycobacterium intracellulare subsp. chimaera]
MLVLNLLLIVLLVIVGLAAHSLGVLAAGLDHLADAAALGVSLFAIWRARRPAAQHRTGRPNATHIAALVNGGCLLALNAGVVVAAIWRLASGTAEIHGLPVLIVSAVAALVMLVSARIVGGHLHDADGNEDLNMKSVLLIIVADAAASAGVAASGAVILITGRWQVLDPVVALVIAVVIGCHAVGLIRRVLTAPGIPTPLMQESAA